MSSGLLQYLRHWFKFRKATAWWGSETGFYKLHGAGTGEGLLSEMGYHKKFITHACHTHRCLEAVNNIERERVRDRESSCYKWTCYLTLLMVPPTALFLPLLKIQFAMIFSSDGWFVLTPNLSTFSSIISALNLIQYWWICLCMINISRQNSCKNGWTFISFRCDGIWNKGFDEGLLMNSYCIIIIHSIADQFPWKNCG